MTEQFARFSPPRLSLADSAPKLRITAHESHSRPNPLTLPRAGRHE